VVGIACVGGAWLSRRALKPVQDITAAALTISIENLSDRLPAPGTGDELAHLTDVLNSMLARLEDAVKTLSRLVADASHAFRTPLAAMISGNRPALHRLFLVLLDNALKYSRAGGDVVVAVDRGDSQVSVTIEDFGIGISAADLPHIFERFYRANRARSDGGHGIGLSL